MNGKTHIAVGIASAMAFCQPKTKAEFIATIIGGAVGGVMADTDVKIDRTNRYSEKNSMDALFGEIAAIAITIAALSADYLSNGEIINQIISNSTASIIGAIAFVVLTIIGELSKHRDRTHSVLALVLFTLAAGFINVNIGVALFAGYLSHLLIDLLNKSPERLFYPLKAGICFKLVYADGWINELLFAAGTGFSVFYTLYLFL